MRHIKGKGIKTILAAAVINSLALSGALATDGVETDRIVVLGSLSPQPPAQIGSALTIIDEEALRLRQTRFVSDILRELPGLAVNRAGPQGSLTQVRIRGAEANQTLVYIDGVEANDPVSGEFNFANLVTADIERIEVIRGPQSALYGSEAIGGVIAITTKSPGAGTRGELELEAGSYDTTRALATLDLGTEQAGLRGVIQHYETGGISASPTGSEDDGYKNLSSSLKGIWRPDEKTRIEASLRYVESEAEMDTQEFTFGTVQDSDEYSESEDLLAKLTAGTTLLDGKLQPRAYLGYTQTETTTFAGDIPIALNKGDRLDLGAQLTYNAQQDNLSQALTLAVGYEELSFENSLQARDDQQTSLIAEYTFRWRETLFLSAAARQDFNDIFDDATTYRLAASWLFPETGTRLHASWGEGITDPTFTERFGFDPNTFVGNPDLQPERSTGYDIGIEQTFLDGRTTIDLTWFETDLEDEISTLFDFTTFLLTPVNLTGTSERQGLELTATAQLTETLSLDAQYTNLDATGSDGLAEVRRPDHIASVNFNWISTDQRASVNLGLDYNGETEDFFFGFSDPAFTPRRDLEGYTLLRLAGSWQVTDTLEIFARGENLLDKDYQEVLGFASPGAAIYLGLRVSAR